MAAVAVVLLIVGYAVTATVQARRVGAERDKAEAVSTFLVSLFEEADPELGAGGAVTAQAMLDAGARRLREEGLVEQPAVRTELATVMGRAYRGLGAYERALAIHYRALAEVEALHGPRSLPTADAHNDVGEVLYDLGRLQEAGAHYDTSLTIRRRHLDRDHVDIAQSLNNLALLDLTRARLDDASVLLAEAVVIFARALGPTHWRTANAQSNLGRVRLMQGRLEHAERLFRAALTAHERGGRTTHRGAAIARHSLASVLLRRGHHAEAERLEREALALLRTQVDAQSPLIGYFLLNLGEAQQGQFLYDDAQRTFEQALDRLQNSLPDDHYRQSEPRLALGLLWMAQDEPRQAGPLLREAVRLVETALGADHWRAAEARSALAACLAASGRTAEARPMLEEAVATLEAARGPQAPATVAARARLAALDDG
jgi:serine/threonine-protein kinase